MDQQHDATAKAQGDDEMLASILRRVEALEAENERLRSAVGARADDRPPEPVATPGTLPGDGPTTTGRRDEHGTINRRGVLAGLAGAVAAGTAVVVAGAQPAAAANGDNCVLGTTNTATSPTTMISGNADPTLSVINNAAGHDGLTASSMGGSAVNGSSATGTGVYAHTVSGSAVHGVMSPDGVNSVTGSAGVFEVLGTISSGRAIYAATAGTGSAITAVQSNPSANADGLRVSVAGSGSGILATTSGTGTALAAAAGALSGFTATAGVLGDSANNYGTCGFSSTKAGVRAASKTAEGVRATSTSSVGGSFSGGRAAINLGPTASTGRPTSGAHSVGDVVVDKNGALYLCTKSGTPGTWVKVTTTPA